MQITGTNELQDLWSDLKFYIHLGFKSDAIKKYDEYKAKGGHKVEPLIEMWKKELAR